MYAKVICPHCAAHLALDVEADAEVLNGTVKKIVNITVTETTEEERLVQNIAEFLNENSDAQINIKYEIVTHCRVSPDYAERLESLVLPLLISPPPRIKV